MNLDEYSTYDAVGLSELVASRQISAAELSSVATEAVRAVDPHINAVIETWEPDQDAFATAEQASGPLAGVRFW
ncbi:hypothetical protein [Rhodococcus opacus]|uniref:hypothetical protein n=1 Tax=Rhodococcus opacus TaxID=37919 RepID=UPI001C43E660|nr:hypothetical protein [Rhodococcus opacus]MBV6760306.1 hypothetical protein [Rhodococcus opacus]